MRHCHIVMLALSATLLGACTTSMRPLEPGAVWPAPPAPPRVAHLLTLDDARQLHRPSWLERLGVLVTGQRRHGFGEPAAVAVDADRLLLVADQKLQGVHVVELGSGRTRFIDRVDGTYLVSPVGVAICGELIAIADGALAAVHLVTPGGVSVRRIEHPQGFGRPTGVAFCHQRKQLYVADTQTHRIDVFGMDGRWQRQIGGPGQEPGQFNFPTHLWIDERRRLYVSDSLNFRVQAFDEEDRYLFGLGRHGNATGHFGVPKGVAVDSFGHIYVVDSYFSTVQIFNERGQLLLSLGSPGGDAGEFAVPGGLAVDADDRIYVADMHNHRIQILQYVGGDDDEPAEHALR